LIITNRHGLPEALVNAVKNDPYDNGGAWRSVTQLIAPPRYVLLRKQHDAEVVEDASEMLYRLYGQIVHQILERANTKDLVEKRLFCEHRGKKISGGFDVLQLSEGRLSDWKFSTAYKATHESEDWVAQTNLLALLFRREGVEIKETEIILLMRDHSRPKARREPEYPQLPVKRMPTTLWSREEQERYLDARVKLHLEAEDKLPQCSAKERWQKPDIYAVMKKGRKTAVKLHSDIHAARSQANAAGDQFHLEVRHGEPTRCLDYCSVSRFCDQFKKEAKVVEQS
jgi:hypothetical protein